MKSSLGGLLFFLVFAEITQAKQVADPECLVR